MVAIPKQLVDSVSGFPDRLVLSRGDIEPVDPVCWSGSLAAYSAFPFSLSLSGGDALHAHASLSKTKYYYRRSETPAQLRWALFGRSYASLLEVVHVVPGFQVPLE